MNRPLTISSGGAWRLLNPKSTRIAALLIGVFFCYFIHLAGNALAEATGGASSMVIIETSAGAITLQLDAEKAPLSVANFLAYVDSGFFNGTIFHRVIPGFMIQGGGMTPDLRQKETKAPIHNEAANGLKNLTGTVAMARTNDPNSATAQFFINLADNAFLDFRDPSPKGIGYAVFGKVVAGMDVVDKIAGVATSNSGQHQNVPKEPVVIQTVRRQ